MHAPFIIRSTTTLLTAMSRMLREDPKEFFNKVNERIRLAKIPMLSRCAAGTQIPETASVQRQLVRQGRLREAASYDETIHLPVVTRRAREELDRLTTDIAKGRPIVASSPVDPVAPLFYLNNSFPFTNSGYTARTHEVLKSLTNADVPTRAVTRLGYPILIGKLPLCGVQTIDGITYQRLMPVKYPRTLSQRDNVSTEMLVQIGQSQHTSVLHTTTDYKNAIVVSRAAQRLGIPWIYEVRGELENTWLSRFPEHERERAKESDFYQLARQQETRAMQQASAVIALSEVSRQSMIERGVSPEKIFVVPNAVDASLIGRKYNQEQLRTELNLPSGLLVGSVSSIVGYEGLDDLIRATAELPDVTCVIVGDGTARPALERLAAKLEIPHRVLFAGRQPSESIWKWYAALDVFVIPRKDTEVTRVVTPIKGLIAQALNKPVVASDLPALKEVTGGLGFYFPAGDISELNRTIRKALVHSPHGQLAWVSSRTWESNAQRLLAIYAGADPR